MFPLDISITPPCSCLPLLPVALLLMKLEFVTLILFVLPLDEITPAREPALSVKLQLSTIMLLLALNDWITPPFAPTLLVNSELLIVTFQRCELSVNFESFISNIM